jgi:peptidoglycan/xylan/chitin deacetylase (PgdA/CDA1 family)
VDIRDERAALVTLVPVLLYHSVHDSPGRLEQPYAVSRATFAEHAHAVAGSGRDPLTVTELADALRGFRPLPARSVAITFDDGYADTLEATETLLRLGLRATIFVTAGEVGRRDRLTPLQLAELAQAPGVEIGAHSVSHPPLDEVDHAQLEKEVTASRRRLEDLTGREVCSFAYPYGAYDERVRAAVMGAGYRSAAAVKDAMSHDRDDPFAIARWTVKRGTTSPRIGEVLDGVGLQRAWSHERLRTRASRAARRSRRRLTRAWAR